METLLRWFTVTSGVVVLALALFGFARLPREPDEGKRRQRLFSLIGSVWLGLSMLLEGVARFFPARTVVLSGLGVLLAFVAIGFFLRSLTEKNNRVSESETE